MPYDKFVQDQLAGDEVPYRDENSIIATGMIRAELGMMNPMIPPIISTRDSKIWFTQPHPRLSDLPLRCALPQPQV